MKDTRCRVCSRDTTGQPATFVKGWWYCEDHSLWPIADDDPINQPPSRIYEPEWASWVRVAENGKVSLPVDLNSEVEMADVPNLIAALTKIANDHGLVWVDGPGAAKPEEKQ